MKRILLLSLLLFSKTVFAQINLDYMFYNFKNDTDDYIENILEISHQEAKQYIPQQEKILKIYENLKNQYPDKIPFEIMNLTLEKTKNHINKIENSDPIYLNRE